MRGYSKVWHGRLLRNIDNMNESDREEFWIELEAQNFADAIDEYVTAYVAGERATKGETDPLEGVEQPPDPE